MNLLWPMSYLFTNILMILCFNSANFNLSFLKFFFFFFFIILPRPLSSRFGFTVGTDGRHGSPVGRRTRVHFSATEQICFPHVLFTFSWSCLCVCVCTLWPIKRRGVVLCASLGLLVFSWGKDSWCCVTFPGRHSPIYRNEHGFVQYRSGTRIYSSNGKFMSIQRRKE